MRTLSAAELSGITQPVVVTREFAWITAKTRGSPVAEVNVGLWSDAGRFTCDVVDGLSGSTVSRTFYGAEVLSFPDVSLVSDISVRTVTLTLSGIGEAAEEMLRTYDLRGAPIQIYRGFFDPATMQIVSAARPRFIGFVDEAPVETASEGSESTITLSCASHTRELLRKSTDVRSHESQILRSASDDFLKDVNVVGEWDIAWGETRKNAGGTSGNGILFREGGV